MTSDEAKRNATVRSARMSRARLNPGSGTIEQSAPNGGVIAAHHPPRNEELLEQWATDGMLREEFGEFERFAAFERACATGRVRHPREQARTKHRALDDPEFVRILGWLDLARTEQDWNWVLGKMVRLLITLADDRVDQSHHVRLHDIEKRILAGLDRASGRPAKDLDVERNILDVFELAASERADGIPTRAEAVSFLVQKYGLSYSAASARWARVERAIGAELPRSGKGRKRSK